MFRCFQNCSESDSPPTSAVQDELGSSFTKFGSEFSLLFIKEALLFWQWWTVFQSNPHSLLSNFNNIDRHSSKSFLRLTLATMRQLEAGYFKSI